MTRRTVHLTNAWHGASGGVKTFYEALLARAADHQRHVAVIVPGERTETIEISPFARVHAIAAPRSPVIDRRYRLLLPHRYATAGSAIRRIIQDERPDLVEFADKHSLVPLAGWLKWRSRGPRPAIVGLSQERADDGFRAHFTASRLAKRGCEWYVRRALLPQFDALIANSHYTAAELVAAIASAGPRQPQVRALADRVHVLPLGVDTDTFSPRRRSEATRRDLLTSCGGGATSSLVVYAGRLSEEKHVATLVPAIARAMDHGADVRLVVVGDGPERPCIEAQAATLSGRVRLLGHCADRRELATLVASADVFLHPNPREPFGIAPLEAMASGTPLVAPDAGGVLSYADRSNAWLAAADAESLGRTLAQALSHDVARESRRAKALATARALTWPRVAARFFETYDAIVSGHRRRSNVNADPVAGLTTSRPMEVSRS